MNLHPVIWICGTVMFVASLDVLRRYLELKYKRPAVPPADTSRERLERIEVMVEATALEVERIAEANRFMSRLLAERDALPPVSRPDRVITPH